MNPIRSFRLALARLACERAKKAYVAYQKQPARGLWQHAIAHSLFMRLVERKRRLYRLVNGW